MSSSRSGTMDRNRKAQNPNKASEESCAESLCNLSLLDPPRWGWTALGGIGDVLPPHERARRKASRTSYLKQKRKRSRSEGGHSAVRRNSGTGAARGDSSAARNEGKVGFVSGTAGEVEGGFVESGVVNADVGQDSNAVRFSALSPNGVLDVRMYHRGREGAELRGEDNGELLCDVAASDTNHTVDAPRLAAPVVIQFPLDDGNTTVGPSDEGEAPKREMYRENMVWDLGNPQTPTPMQFATDVAQNFGLSFPQTLELAESIQGQLRAFVNDNCSYAPPISLLSDASQNRPQYAVPSLYGQATGELEEGHCRVVNQKCRAVSRSSSGILRPPTSEKLASKGKIPAKRKRESVSVRDQTVEKVYKDEVQKRLRRSSESEIKEKWEATDQTAPLGEIVQIEDGKCHSCQRQGRCGGFACGAEGHAYCSEHLKALFDSLQVKQVPGAVALSFCPICALSCACSPCSKRLDTSAADFKKESLKQNVSPELTVFDNLFSRSKGTTTKSSQKKRGRWAKRKDLKERPIVPKVPGSEFPREVFNGVDIDPGTESIYGTVYTKDGSFVKRTDSGTADVPQTAQEVKANNGAVAEDGSVDYCLVCRKVGNLLCCDFCPRAFHGACVPSDDPKVGAKDDKWECPSCRKEKAGLLNDKLDGSEHLEMVSSAFCFSDKEGTVQATEIISILYKMVLVLKDYDFGFMFKSPVDTTKLPSYKKIVKHPMDLGTITLKISEGKYKGESPDDVVLSILKDVELVWHNCFLFNLEGSAVYRMAEVQRRRAVSIRKQSFESLLSEEVKQHLQDYIDACAKRRLSVALSQGRASSLPSRQPNRAQPRHKITATSAGINGRPIAAFDPDSGTVVKIYRTMKAVQGVADLFFNLKHPCEWERKEIDSSGKIRKLIIESTTDPRIRMFGYRWIFFDDLERGKISLVYKEPKEPKKEAPPKIKNGARPAKQAAVDAGWNQGSVRGVLEMIAPGERCFVFGSVELALSYGDVVGTDRPALREWLNALSTAADPNGQLGETKWRKIGLPEEQQNGYTPGDDWGISRLPGIVAVKRDMLSKQALVGFRRFEDAYEDWARSVKSCRSLNGISDSKEMFRQGFLEGTHNVDGVEWMSVGTAKQQETPAAAMASGGCDDGSESKQQSAASGCVTKQDVTMQMVANTDGGAAQMGVPVDGATTPVAPKQENGTISTVPEQKAGTTQMVPD